MARTPISNDVRAKDQRVVFIVRSPVRGVAFTWTVVPCQLFTYGLEV